MFLHTQNFTTNTVETLLEAITIRKIGNFGIYGHFEDSYNTNIFLCFLQYRSRNYALQLQWLIEKFLQCFWESSGHVTTSTDFRFYKDTKIISVRPLENIGYPILKKRPPRSPFESNFSYKCFNFQKFPETLPEISGNCFQEFPGNILMHAKL